VADDTLIETPMFLPPRCDVVPLPDDQVSLRIDGREHTRWCFPGGAPRPYFYPLIGPASGESLTRMGHPGAPDHDHHRSVFWAHYMLLGINFWNDETDARIRQLQWLTYDEGDEATIAVRLGWFDGHDPAPLVEQDMIASLIPWRGGEYILDVQGTFRPQADSIEFQQTNFGFFAVRVAKSISAVFGGGRLTSSEGLVGESAIFGQPARWMDYSGPMVVRRRPRDLDLEPLVVTEGITYLDHPDHPFPMRKWHVRDDGWMCCSPCMDAPLVTTAASPLSLRYALYVHSGEGDPAKIEEVLAMWRARPWRKVQPSQQPHHHFELAQM
jgi:hypothetical protein